MVRDKAPNKEAHANALALFEFCIAWAVLLQHQVDIHAQRVPQEEATRLCPRLLDCKMANKVSAGSVNHQTMHSQISSCVHAARLSKFAHVSSLSTLPPQAILCARISSERQAFSRFSPAVRYSAGVAVPSERACVGTPRMAE